LYSYKHYAIARIILCASVAVIALWLAIGIFLGFFNEVGRAITDNACWFYALGAVALAIFMFAAIVLCPGIKEAIQAKKLKGEAGEQAGGSNDSFSRESRAKALAQTILAREQDDSFTVAVYGGWGSGKTWFLKKVEQELKQQTQGKQAPHLDRMPEPVTVYFDAWQHQKSPNPVVPMLACARDAMAKMPHNPLRIQELEDRLGSIAELMLETLDLSLGKATFGLPSFQTIRESARRKAEERFRVEDESERLQKELALTIDILASVEQAAADSPSNAAENHSAQISPIKRKVVFIIDELDRCEPEKAAELLEEMKVYLGSKHSVFILGIDQDAVEYAIAKHKKYDTEEEKEKARLYLEKFINLRINLPLLGNLERGDFLRKCLKDSRPGGGGGAAGGASAEDKRKEELVIAILTEACDICNASIRKMQQLTAIYEYENNCLNNAFAAANRPGYHPAITATLVAVREFWPEEYKDLCGGDSGRDDRWMDFFDPAGRAIKQQNSNPAAT